MESDIVCRVIRPTYIYVDQGYESPCHRSWGSYSSEVCEELEVKEEDKWHIYRCVYCHDKELKAISCLGTIQSGRRCKREDVDEEGYCTRHRLTPRDRFKEELDRYDPSRLYNWNDHYELAAINRAKRIILKDISLSLQIAKIQLDEMMNLEERLKTYVYFIQCKNYVKIGKADSPKSRLKTLQNASDITLKPDDITPEDMKNARIIATVKGSKLLESVFHQKLSSRRVKGEWFVLDSVVAKTIELSQSPDFDLKSLLQMAMDDPSLLPETSPSQKGFYKYRYFGDFAFDEAIESANDAYQYHKEEAKNPTPIDYPIKVDLVNAGRENGKRAQKNDI
jgi:hypothetical protein